LQKTCNEKLEIANRIRTFVPLQRFQMNSTIESNPLLDRLPKHLKQFIKPQDYSDYTPINQAVWRYVMQNGLLVKVAHSSYLEGLKKRE
jgi:phenylalanine-4-hydroxylase